MNNRPVLIKRVLAILSIATVLICVYLVVSGLYYLQNTGTLEIRSKLSDYSLAISQPEKENKQIGDGDRVVRLNEGDYVLSANKNGFWNYYKIHISKKSKVVQYIELPDAAGDDDVFNNLPYSDKLGPFNIDFRPSLGKDGSLFPALEFSSSTPPGRVNGLEWLRDNGGSPANYRIDFKDFISPLINGDTQYVTH